jgi:hypothetical protein
MKNVISYEYINILKLVLIFLSNELYFGLEILRYFLLQILKPNVKVCIASGCFGASMQLTNFLGIEMIRQERKVTGI